MLRSALALSLVVLLAATQLQTRTVAQTQQRIFLTDGDPTKGSANTFPWSREQLRYQCLFPAAKFKSRPWTIQDILVAPQLTMTPKRRTGIYEDIEIRIGQTAVTTLQRDWNKNNPKPTVIYRGKLRVDFEVGKWSPLGLPKSFLYIPRPTDPNLCVEFIMWKLGPNTTSIRAVNDRATQRAFYYQWTRSQQTNATIGGGAAKMGLVVNSGSFAAIGEGCNGTGGKPRFSTNGIPTLGKTLIVDMSGGKPSSPAVVVLGFNRNTYASIPLPFDLRPLGAPGCLVWNDFVVTGGRGIDAQGNAKFLLPLPPSLSGAPRIFLHWWNLDTSANAFRWTTSNLAVVIPGR